MGIGGSRGGGGWMRGGGVIGDMEGRGGGALGGGT